MKSRFIFTSALILLFIPYSNAQLFKASLLAGANMAQIEGDYAWGYHKIGACGGGSISLKIKKNNELEFQILYSQKGAYSGPGQMYLNTRLNYIEFPLLLNIKIYKKLYLSPGIYGGYLLNAKSDNTGWGMVDIYRNLNKYDIGIQASAEHRFNIKWAVNIKFSYSLIPISTPNKSSNAFIYNSAWYNNCANLMLKYSF